MTTTPYTVTCRGERSPPIANARERLASAFGIATKEVDRLLRGDGILRCGPLPREPARQLYDHLEAAGVHAYLDRAEPSAIDPKAPASHCGHCGTRRLMGGSCAWCGYGARASVAAGEEVAEVDPGEAQSARRVLRLALGVAISVLCLDWVMGVINTYRAALLLSPVLELGTPIKIAMLGLLTYATWRYAKARARPAWAGLLGAAGAAGLAILMLWDWRDEITAHGRLRISQTLIIGVSSLIVGSPWLANIANTTWQLERQKDQAQDLRARMPLTNSEAPNHEAGAVDAMRQRVDSYVMTTLATVAGSGLTPSRIAAQVDDALGVYTRQLMWHNQALVANHSPDNRFAWQDLEALQASRQNRLERFGRHLEQEGAYWPAINAFDDWRGMAYRRDQPQLADLRRDLHRRLVNMTSWLARNSHNAQLRARLIRRAIDHAFADDERYQTNYRQRRFRITITQGPAAVEGRSVVYGWLYHIDNSPDTPPGGDRGSRMIRIGGDLSDQYLTGLNRAVPRIIPDRSE